MVNLHLLRSTKHDHIGIVVGGLHAQERPETAAASSFKDADRLDTVELLPELCLLIDDTL